MLDCLSFEDAECPRVFLTRPGSYSAWLASQATPTKRWLEQTQFKAKPGALSLYPGEQGEISGAISITSDDPDLWDVSSLASKLPTGTWSVELDDTGITEADAALGWALSCYRFDRYKKSEKSWPVLAIQGGPVVNAAVELAKSIYLGRDLVNTPTNDLGPVDLAKTVEELAVSNDASFECIVGDELLSANYPAIHAVGRASADAPRLIDLRWGDNNAPKLTLVGKGVCFDTGGLDLKPASGMRLMKKDMGGSAAMIALARAVMVTRLDVRLRLLVPAVENSVSSSAFRPGDILSTRKGITVEVGNTDAEGRLILCDALAEAVSESPDLVIDAATLTGAARVALGSQLPVMFANHDRTADSLIAAGEECVDPVWRLPLHAGYRKQLNSSVADIGNISGKPQAGAITAALFLQEFVGKETDWLHLDIFGWNDETRPGRPRGGEATAVRALYNMLCKRYRSSI